MLLGDAYLGIRLVVIGILLDGALEISQGLVVVRLGAGQLFHPFIESIACFVGNAELMCGNRVFRRFRVLGFRAMQVYSYIRKRSSSQSYVDRGWCVAVLMGRNSEIAGGQPPELIFTRNPRNGGNRGVISRSMD